MIDDAYGARRARQVMVDTWGHLRPETGRHAGHLVAAFSAYGGERLLISADFGDVPDSPWLYEAMYEQIADAEMEEGHVYLFTGALEVTRRVLTFVGEWSQVPIAGGSR